MKHYALIGGHLSHSYSKQYFDSKFKREGLLDCSYSLCEMASLQGIRQWVAENGIAGFNVTFPHKQSIVAYLDELDPAAAAIGAVNCVVVKGDGRLVGYNTDAPAFARTVQPILPEGTTHALVLGRGGAAHAACHVLEGMGIECLTTNHRLNLYHSDCQTAVNDLAIADYRFQLLVNATPVGTYPHIANTPWPWPEVLQATTAVYDMVYNPSPTRLMTEAKRQGCAVRGGLDMLHLQADLSWQLWQA